MKVKVRCDPADGPRTLSMFRLARGPMSMCIYGVIEYTTTIGVFPATFRGFPQRHVAGETYPQRNVTGESSSGIQSPAIIPSEDVGPTRFSVKQLVPRWQTFPQRHVAGESLGLIKTVNLIMKNVVSNDVYIGLVYSENVADVWKELNETYDKVDGSVVYNLLQKIGSVKQGGSTVADYYHRLNSLWREFDAITKLPKCVCPVKCSCATSTELALHQQLLKLMQFLMGLDDCYQPVRTALLTRDPLPDVKDAYATVSREEFHRGIPETSEAIDTKMNAISFAAKSYNQNKSGNTNNFNRNNNRGNGTNHLNRGPNLNLVCKNCGFTGHTIERCYELIRYLPGYKKGPNASMQNVFKPNFNANCDTKGSDKQPTTCNSPTSFTTEQMQKLLNLIHDSSSENTQANMAGRISFFNGNVWFNVNFSKFYCGNTKFLVKTITLGWIIDSEANQHLATSTISMISNVDISNLNITVGHLNGTVATISHVGDLRLSNNVILYDVLVVPGYCVSLLFVNKLIKDNKLFVRFDEDKCYIRDLDKGITLGTGSESGGLYLFDDTKNKILGNVNTVMAFNVSKDLWHSRLGHPADQVLNVLKNDLNLSKNTSVSICETCHRAKQTREPFPLSNHKSEKHGELVHLDLWGPYRVSSIEGFKYFLTIVDDYSRAVWTYLLKTKDEVFDCFVNFIKLIHNQYNATIKTIRSDNGTEFSTGEFLTTLWICLFDIRINVTSGTRDTGTGETWHKGDYNSCGTTVWHSRLGHPADQDENLDLNNIDPSGDHNLEEGRPSVRRSSRPTKMPAKFNDFMLDSKLKYGIEKHVNYSKLNTVNYCFATTLNKSIEPTTYYEDVKDVRWVEAINNEIEALIKNNTWTLTDLPIGKKTIDNKWLYKIKYKASDQVDKYKARVVAKGFSQREGIDFDETFSLVVKMFDVNNAFLYGDLNEDIYMSLPLGFECSDKNKVYKLNKALYGLKQAPRQWNAKLTTVLAKHGFVQSKFDYSLYIKHNDNVFVALLVYVDDFIITYNSLYEIENFKLFLKSNFMIKDLGIMKYFLGIEVLENSNGICMTQRKYCLELIHEVGLLAAKPVTTPLPENCVLAVDESKSDNQHMHAPLQSHLKVALRVIRYLKNSLGIQIYKDKNLKLSCFTDFNRAKCLRTRKSMSGYCVFFGKSLVSWKSKKQNTVSRSSAEAEYRCMASATCEVIWISNLLNDLCITNLLPVNLYSDSSSAIQIAANPVFHERTKHFEVDVHLVREKVQDCVINTIKVASSDQTANLFTKGHGTSQHLKLCNQLSLVDMFGK
ncbi:ribonuclease H-like domain-containing protein [Tanacetum coccineum]